MHRANTRLFISTCITIILKTDKNKMMKREIYVTSFILESLGVYQKLELDRTRTADPCGERDTPWCHNQQEKLGERRRKGEHLEWQCLSSQWCEYAHHWKCSRPDWMSLWATWHSGRCSSHGRKVGTQWTLRSLPTLLWFYDPVQDKIDRNC